MKAGLEAAAPDWLARNGFAHDGTARALFSRCGQFESVLLATDWSGTGLGPVGRWPQCLRTVSQLVLASPVPMAVYWGSELSQLYNEAYGTSIGLDPASLGVPAAQSWAQLWHVVGPVAQGVLAGAPAATLELPIFTYAHAKTTARQFAFSFSPILDDEGRVGGLLCTARETTVDGDGAQRAEHELAAQLAAARADLDRANAEFDAFSYSVSHDLRAPLRAVDGFSSALLEDQGSRLSEQGTHQLQRVRAGAQRMAHLLDDLLALSRVTRASLARESIDITSLARAILADHAALTPERRVTVHVREGLVANADPDLTQALLARLLDNAWKFTAKRPEATIEVSSSADSAGTFWIRDDGAGFELQYAKRLFTPFQRMHTEAQFAGTGIGLAIAHRVVSRHEGRIWVEAEPDQGATFFFTLSR